MSELLFGDFETRSTTDIRERGADVYARDPSTEVMAFGYAFGDEPVTVLRLFQKPPQRVIDHVYKGKPFIAHNAPFEWLIWNYVWRPKYDLPALIMSSLECTMARSYAMGLPGSLEKSAAALGIDKQKDLKGGRVMLQLSQPRDIDEKGNPQWWCPIEFEDKYEQMYAYCGQDIEVEREIYKRTLALNDNEKDVWLLDFEINQRGVQVDVESAKQAVAVVEMETERLHEEIRSVTSNQVATTSANKQLTDWLRSCGVETQGVAKSDVSDLLEKTDLPSACRRALEIRREAAKSSTAKFSTLLHRVCADGRMRSNLQYCGAAATGRWAGRGFQLHNLPRPKLSESEIEGVFECLLT